MKRKNIILTMLVLLGVVTFLDRINISVAGSSIMHDLNLSAAEWGWVQSAFILSYGLMQIPMGALGDRYGHRKILSMIVLWWSLFTAFTGMAGGLASLLVIRFMFGIGEAGSSPCSTGVISRWFEKHEVGKAQGYVWAASRMGGALTPFVVIPVMTLLGWREAFYILGALGIVWAAVWYFYYRDRQPETAKETVRQPIPWRTILHHKQFWIICAMYFFYAFGSWFFFSWFPTFMELGRGFAKSELTYAVAVPFIMSMIGNISGGYLTDRLTKKYGLKIGRKALGSTSLAVSAVCMFLAAFIPGKMAVFVFLSLCFGIFDLMLPSAWALCIDLGKQHAGTISGAMNTAGNLGGFFCGILFGQLVQSSGNYNLPLYMIAGMLIISAALFALINPTKPIVEKEV
ncbi:MAG: MFS transporter [Prevotella sp.]|nr:MFS transporter [Prevotella sp.]MBP3827434.1 MFS transporter [Prevotella sp.]MBQ3828393.1 MFS transporter [Prevotella sp.]MBQ4147536.1 MFS transporter [Prevotella sp.]MBQ6308609.1 MFS transporter [Prevotella sp.]